MENLQRMTVGLSEVKLDDTSTGSMGFKGHGAAFNNVDAYGDVIAPGAFAVFLSDMTEGKEPWPAMLSQHGGMGFTAQDLTPIGAYTALAEDGKGLAIEGNLAATPRGTEMHVLMGMVPRPAIDGLSIGYIAKKADRRTRPEEPRRTLREIVVREISLVTFPANRDARVTGVKSIEEIGTLSEIESLLRDAGGFSRKEAMTIVARIKSCRSDDAGADEIVNALNALQSNFQT